jgi:hypothetical protein
MVAARRDDVGRVHQGVVRCNEGLGDSPSALVKELFLIWLLIRFWSACTGQRCCCEGNLGSENRRSKSHYRLPPRHPSLRLVEAPRGEAEAKATVRTGPGMSGDTGCVRNQGCSGDGRPLVCHGSGGWVCILCSRSLVKKGSNPKTNFEEPTTGNPSRLTAYEFSGNTLLSCYETAQEVDARREALGRVHLGVVRCNEGLGVTSHAEREGSFRAMREGATLSRAIRPWLCRERSRLGGCEP